MTTLDTLAPWPTRSRDVTAKTLLAAIAVRGYARTVWASANIDDRYTHTIAADSISADATTVDLIDTLTQLNEQAADEVARWIWRMLNDGEEVRERLWRAVRDAGIDPKQVEQAAREET